MRSGNRQPERTAYAVVADFLALRDRLCRADAIIAFGCRDLTVAGQAARLHADGWAPWVVVTGGVPFDDGRSEAEAFADHMIASGVPPERILVEAWSRHTGENVGFALDVLGDRVPDLRTVIAVPWPLAARRAVATVRHQAPDLEVISAPDRTGPDGRRPYGPRAVRLALAELDRLDRYVAAGFIAAQPVPVHVRAAGAILAAGLDAVAPEMTAV